VISQASRWPPPATTHRRSAGERLRPRARLTGRLLEGLRTLPGIRVVGPDTTEMRGSAVSFDVAGVHPHDVGQSLDELGIAVRVGHHCAAPVCRRYGVPATARASTYLYNTEAEVDALVEGLGRVQAFWGA
jgi:cysteine desulfurase/selenocysteine lyase